MKPLAPCALAAFLALSVAGDASASLLRPARPQPRNWVENVAGVYVGRVTDDGELVPQVLRLRVQADGRLVGTYEVFRGDQTYTGTFDGCTVEPPLGLTFVWRDLHGEGIATLRFTADGNAFKGHWGEQQIRLDLRLDGTRVGP